MQGPRTALSRRPRRPPTPADTRPTPPHRILIHTENATTWELVGGGPVWMVEHTGLAGTQRHTLEAFEKSEDGQRLANSLTVALARTPDA